MSDSSSHEVTYDSNIRKFKGINVVYFPSTLPDLL